MDYVTSGQALRDFIDFSSGLADTLTFGGSRWLGEKLGAYGRF